MACVEPAYWTMIMPLKVQQNFNKTMLGANDIAFWRATWEYFMYNSTNNNNTNFVGLPDGDFSLELDGITVTIPKEEWIYPAVQPNYNSGAWTNVPGSIQTTMGTAGWPDGVDAKLPFLGGPFLSQVYLVVNYETGVFSLAPINRGASTGSQGLIKLGCDTDHQVVPSSGDKPILKPKKKDSKIAPIVGGVVGGVVALGLIILAIMYCRRRSNPEAPPEADILPPTKEQIEAHHGFHHQPYDAPPAFSPSPSPGPYSPPNSPGPYMGMAAVPMRRPLPGQDYPQTGSPPPGHNGYYDGQQGYDGQGYNASSRTSEPVELRGTDVLSELSGSQPRSYSGAYDASSVVSGQTNNR